MISFFKDLFFNIKRLQLFIASFVTVLVFACANAKSIKIKTLDRFPAIKTTWEITENPFKILLNKNSSLPVGNPEFCLRNGKTLGNMKPVYEKISSAKGIAKVFAKYKGGLEVLHEIGSKGTILTWKMIFTNKSGQELWFEPSLRFPLKNTRQGTYWDGLNFHKLPKRFIERNILNHTFPIACLINKKIGFALGTSPVIDSSYLRNGINKQNKLYYATRIALPPNQKTSFEFITFAFVPNYQHLDAVAVYYQAFNSSFTPANGVDPRLVSGRCTDLMQTAQCKGINKQSKVLRAIQNYGGVEWGYTCYRRQGDFYGRKEHWDDYNLTQGELVKLQRESRTKMNKINIDESHKDLAFIFSSADYRANTIMSFYIFNYVEKGLIKKGHMEKYIYPSNVGVPAYRRAWGLSHGLSGHIYPWATPFETILRKDLTDLVRDFDIRAICQDGFSDLDCITPIGRSEVFRGKLDYYLPGWSYDSKGKYIRKGIALRHNVDFIHTLTKGNLRIGHLANMWWGSPLLSFAPDAYLSECFNYSNVHGKNYQTIKQGQLFRGKKPLYYHDWGQMQLGDVLPWENMSPEDLRLAYEDFIRELMNSLYQTAMIPSYYLVASHKPIYRELPLFLEVTSRGFSPVPAIRGKENLERVRYGEALNSAMVLSNRDRFTKTITETIDNDYLGDYSTLPILLRGAKKLKFTVSDRQTIFKINIKAQENMIIAVPVAIKLKKENKLEIESRLSRNYHEKKYSYTINTPITTQGTINVTPDREYALDLISLNGAKVINGGKIVLKAGKNKLFVNTKSTIFLNQDSEYGKFNFVNADIILDNDAADREKGTARMIQDFIQFKLKSKLKISTTSTKTSGNIILTRKLKNKGIYIDKNNKLYIANTNAFELQQNVSSFLRMLERTDVRFRRTNWKRVGGRTDSNIRMCKKMWMQKRKVYDESKSTRRVIWSNIKRNKNVKNTKARISKNINPVPVLSVPMLNAGITLDGKLNDSIWSKAALVKDFVILYSKPTKYPFQKTEVRIFVTKQNLYVGFRCFEKNMNRLMSYCTKRDGMIWLDDDFELRLAPGIGSNSFAYPYFCFLTNSKGIQLDILQLPNQMPDSEASNFVGPNWAKKSKGTNWNAKWKVKTFIDKDSWSGEIIIPLNEINGLNKNTWRIHFARMEQPNVERSCWPKIIGRSINQPSFFAVMKIKR